MPRPCKEKITLPKKRGRKPKLLSAPKVPVSTQTKKQIETLETLKGFKDILPLDAPYWDFVRGIFYDLAKSYSFKIIETPVLEQLALFKRNLGKYTDIVEKELFEFIDKGGVAVALRPEGTSGVARSYINHGMHNLPQPVKVFYDGPMFRYENPQAGRMREHHQIGFEVFGSESSAVEVQLMLLAHNALKEIGLSSSLEINSMGCASCRETFKEALVEYYKSRRRELCEDCKRRISKNPIRLLDCKEEMCQPIKENAPQIIDFLDENCKKHFMQVLEMLDELEIPYNLNPFLVRGLDYYTRTVFEFRPLGEQKSQSALLGGGRFDVLVEQMGGQPTSAAGMACGLERLIMRIKEEGVLLPAKKRPDIFLAHLGPDAKKRAMRLFEELRKEGFALIENFAKDSLKQQLENANKARVRFTLILGQKELQENNILLRDMDAGVQEEIDIKKLVPELRKKLEQKSLLPELEEGSTDMI